MASKDNKASETLVQILWEAYDKLYNIIMVLDPRTWLNELVYYSHSNCGIVISKLSWNLLLLQTNVY